MTEVFELRDDRATVRVHRIGATVLSYVEDGDELLWVSPNAVYAPGTAIRGGIPVCWPWFAGDRPGPAHGIARTREWALVDGPPDALTFELTDMSARAGDVWPHPFRMGLTVALGDALTVTLRYENRADTPVDCTGALHSYLRVSDLANARVHGLDGAPYLDKVLGAEAIQRGPLAIDREIDRIHRTRARVHLEDGPRRVRVDRSSGTAVVWNPGPAAAAKPDLGPGTHLQFVCIEAAVTGGEVAHVPPGDAFELVTRITARG
ncbi:MAG: D-hexose-6-phosphate mutarotase [Myxococcota bacterium]